jgi:hypothetical protein
MASYASERVSKAQPCTSSFFNCREEALGDGVVVAVTSGAHTAPRPVLVEQAAALVTGVLAAAVGVMGEPWWRLAACQGVLHVDDRLDPLEFGEVHR